MNRKTPSTEPTVFFWTFGISVFSGKKVPLPSTIPRKLTLRPLGVDLQIILKILGESDVTENVSASLSARSSRFSALRVVVHNTVRTIEPLREFLCLSDDRLRFRRFD
jgi:hypothetical protein